MCVWLQKKECDVADLCGRGVHFQLQLKTSVFSLYRVIKVREFTDLTAATGQQKAAACLILLITTVFFPDPCM